MLIISIIPNEIQAGDTPCIVFYNLGGDSFPTKELLIESSDITFVDDDGIETNLISWQNDSVERTGFSHEFIIRTLNNLSDGDQFNVTMIVTGIWGHKESDHCLIHFKS